MKALKIVFFVILVIAIILGGAIIYKSYLANQTSSPVITVDGIKVSSGNQLEKSIAEVTQAVPIPEEEKKLLGDEKMLKEYLKKHQSFSSELVTSIHNLFACNTATATQKQSAIFSDAEATYQYIYCVRIHAGTNEVFWSSDNIKVEISDIKEVSRKEDKQANKIIIEQKGNAHITMAVPLCISAIEKVEPPNSDLLYDLQTNSAKPFDPQKQLFSFGVWLSKPEWLQEGLSSLLNPPMEYQLIQLKAEQAARKAVISQENITTLYKETIKDTQPGGHFHQSLTNFIATFTKDLYNSVTLELIPDSTNTTTRCDGQVVE